MSINSQWLIQGSIKVIKPKSDHAQEENFREGHEFPRREHDNKNEHKYRHRAIIANEIIKADQTAWRNGAWLPLRSREPNSIVTSEIEITSSFPTDYLLFTLNVDCIKTDVNSEDSISWKLMLQDLINFSFESFLWNKTHLSISWKAFFGLIQIF